MFPVTVARIEVDLLNRGFSCLGEVFDCSDYVIVFSVCFPTVSCQDYILRFGLWGERVQCRWNGGVATIEESPGAEVWGVVWKLSNDNLDSLDK